MATCIEWTRGRLTLWVLCLAMTACGCYNQKEVVAFLHKPRSPVSGVEYRIFPPDVLAINSVLVQEISGLTQQVRPDGRINLPLLGEVYVAGKTPKEVEEMLVNLSHEYYSKATVTVEVINYNSRRFYVFGQVQRPGPIAWTGHDTLLDALSQAQPNDLSWPQHILVVRGDDPKYGGMEPNKMSLQYAAIGVKPEEPERPRHKMVVNMQAMVEIGDMSNNVLLMPDDIVYVPPNPLAQLGLWIQTILFPLSGARQVYQEYQYWEKGAPYTFTTTTTTGGPGGG